MDTKESEPKITDAVTCYVVIDKSARWGESIDSIWFNKGDAKNRADTIRAYRVEEHVANVLSDEQ